MKLLNQCQLSGGLSNQRMLTSGWEHELDTLGETVDMMEMLTGCINAGREPHVG